MLCIEGQEHRVGPLLKVPLGRASQLRPASGMWNELCVCDTLTYIDCTSQPARHQPPFYRVFREDSYALCNIGACQKVTRGKAKSERETGRPRERKPVLSRLQV